MSVILVALGGARGRQRRAELEHAGVTVSDAVEPEAAVGALSAADIVLVPAVRGVLTPDFIAACDRAHVRIVALGTADFRLLGRHGLPDPLPEDIETWRLIDALDADAPPLAPSPPPSTSRRVIAVWGLSGAPGRSTIAIQLAVELRRNGRRCALLDADTVAPSLALLLGMDDDAPGLAAACRRAELGGLDAAELGRLALSLETSAGTIELLGGLNRPGRWPELSASRLRTTLRACRDWVDDAIVDVSAFFETDEELTDDLVGPRRHAATVAALREADVIVAVTAADPLSASRFLRDHAELRRLVGPGVPVVVVVNRVRPGPLGIDARGQVRRTLDRFAGISPAHFLPLDQRAVDASLLHARPVADVAPRSAFVTAIRRLAASLAGDDERAAATGGRRRGSSPGARRPRSRRAAPEESRRGSDRASAN